MNLAKRAGLYTIRHKEKSLILFVVLVVISTLILTGISITGAVNQTVNHVRTDIGGRIHLDRLPPELDIEALLGELVDAEDGVLTAEDINSDDGNLLTWEILEAILDIDGVNDYNLTAEFMLQDASSTNFDFLSDGFEFDTRLFDHSMASLQSSTNSELMDGFANGNLRLESGRHLTADDHRSVLISDELAEYNNLTIGDTLKVSGTSTHGVSDTTLELEIVGIFSGTRGIGGFLQSDIPSNRLIIDMSSLMEEYERSNFFGTGIAGSLPGAFSVSAHNSNDIQSVYDEILNLPQIYGKEFVITMGAEGFEGISDSLGSLQVLVYTLLVIITVVSMGILAILLTIWTRGRVKEIGIFLANGIKKKKIISQFIFEVLVIAVVAFAVSLPIGHLTATRAGDFVMIQFTATQELQNEQLEGASRYAFNEGGIVLMQSETGLMNDSTIENTLDMVDVGVVGADLIWVYVIGLPVVTSSVLIASYTVVKLKPKEILSKMS